MKPTDEGAFQRPYPFTIDNRASPLDAHQAGRLAWGLGKGFLDNPYPDGSTEFRRYVDGLVDAIKGSSQPQIQANANATPAG